MNEERMMDHVMDLQATILSLQNKNIELEKQIEQLIVEKNRIREIVRPIPEVNPVVSESLEYLRIVAG